MARNKTRFHILWVPGMGADTRMFRDISLHLPDSLGPYKLEHHAFRFFNIKSDNLEQFTIQCAQKQSIMDSYDLIVGCSMGGMISQILVESGTVKTDKLFLLSSITSGNQMTAFAYYGSFLILLLPGFLRKTCMKIIARLYPVFRSKVSSAKWLAKMFQDFPPDVFFLAPVWIRKWKGSNLPDSLSIYRVHGTSDPLLSFSKIKSSRTDSIDLIVENGSHILFATIPRKIAAAIEKFILDPVSKNSLN